jgi:TRAP-type mannitol/chloroaromatic compound transport system permease large subunit
MILQFLQALILGHLFLKHRIGVICIIVSHDTPELGSQRYHIIDHAFSVTAKLIGIIIPVINLIICIFGVIGITIALS